VQRLFVFFLLCLSFSNYSQNNKAQEQVIFDRINYLYQLKDILAKETWPSFGETQYDIPIIYYTENASYVANPTNRIIRILKPKLVFQNQTLKIYETHPRVDTIEYHMATNYETTDSLRQYNYNSPCLNCSSPEIIRKTDLNVKSTEQWAATALSEYFHGFQYHHKALVQYSKKNFLYVSGDGFKKFYNKNIWFKQSVDKENELLLAAIAEPNDALAISMVKKFFVLRDGRRQMTKQKLNFNIGKYERYYETIEGTARYIELSLYEKFASLQPDSALQKSDVIYQSYKRYKNYKIENDAWLYQTSKSTYIYAIGLNMVRLLDRLKIDYKSKLFNDGYFSLEDFLKEATVIKAKVE
jgi:hypothetical protein